MSIFQESFDKLRKATNDRQSIIKWIRDNTYVNESTTVDGATTGYSAYFGYDLCFFMVCTSHQYYDGTNEIPSYRYYGNYRYKGKENTTDMWLELYHEMWKTINLTRDLYHEMGAVDVSRENWYGVETDSPLFKTYLGYVTIFGYMNTYGYKKCDKNTVVQYMFRTSITDKEGMWYNPLNSEDIIHVDFDMIRLRKIADRLGRYTNERDVAIWMDHEEDLWAEKMSRDNDDQSYEGDYSPVCQDSYAYAACGSCEWNDSDDEE